MSGLGARLRHAVTRVLRSDFGRDGATDEERAELLEVGSPLAQDYAAWRGSVLLLAATFLVGSLLLQLLGFETLSDAMVEGQMAAAAQQGMFLTEGEVRAGVEANFGAGNLTLLDSIAWMSLLATLAVTALAVVAARGWRRPGASSRVARLAWVVLVGAPLLLAILPWSRMLDFSHMPPQDASALQSMLGVTLGLSFFFVVAPKLLSVFPGLIRASVTLKTLLHESPVPGYTVVLFAPVYAMFVLVVFTTLNQIQGDLLLLAGVGCLVLAPLVYLWRARDFLRPHTADESATLVRGVRRQAYLFNAAGTAIVVLFLLDLDTVSALQVMEFVVTAGGGVLLTTVVAADLVLGLLRLEHGQAKGFVGSDLATAFEEKLAALEGTGLGR